jgi:hypothetical protein
MQVGDESTIIPLIASASRKRKERDLGREGVVEERNQWFISGRILP